MMQDKKRFWVCLIASLVSLSANAQNERLVEAKAPTPTEKKADGWHFGASIGAALGWNFNNSFVGVTDGHYLDIGGKASGFAEYFFGKHEWRNTLTLTESFKMAPQIPDRLIKSADWLEFDSIYQYHITDWFGAFAQLSIDTNIFAGKNIQASPVTYITDGVRAAQTAKELDLSTPFQPFYLRENLGVFAQPIREAYLLWEWRAAAGFVQTFANGQKAVTKTDLAAGTVEVKSLASFYQIGPVIGTSVSGMLYQNKLSYKAGIDVLYIAWQTNKTQKTFPSVGDIDSYNFDAYAGLSLNLVEWLSIEWAFKTLRIAEIIPQWQIQNMVLLTASYSI